MTPASPPLVLDAGILSIADGDPSSRDLTRALLRHRSSFAAVIRSGPGGIETVRAEAEAPSAAGEALCRWLRGTGPRPPHPVLPRMRGADFAWPWRSTPNLPHDAVILKPGLHGWRDARWQAWRRRHPAIPIIALLDVPVALDWPEYETPSDVAALPDRLEVVARMARAVVVPDAPTKAVLGACLAALPQGHRPIVIEPPSAMDDDPPPFEPSLAAQPFFLVIDRVEARANTALLLHVWRDLIGGGGRVPKLVLAGERGHQTEEIRPLLRWNGAIAAAVAEAPDLPPGALRHLARHARAVLAPAFAGGPAALLGDLKARGIPVIASDTPSHAAALGPQGLLSPLDGRGWRAAIVAAAEAGAPVMPVPPARDRSDYLPRLAALAASL